MNETKPNRNRPARNEPEKNRSRHRKLMTETETDRFEI